MWSKCSLKAFCVIVCGTGQVLLSHEHTHFLKVKSFYKLHWLLRSHLHLLQSLQFSHQILDLSIFLRQHGLQSLQLSRISPGALQLHQSGYLHLHQTRTSTPSANNQSVTKQRPCPDELSHSTFKRCICCLLKACIFCSDWYWTFILMSCLSISARLSSSCNTTWSHLLRFQVRFKTEFSGAQLWT